MYIGLHVQYPLFLSDFNQTWIFSADFIKILKSQIPSKFFQWKASCFMQPDVRTDRRTYMTKLIVFFFFANLPASLKMVRDRHVSWTPATEWYLVSLQVCDLKLIVSKKHIDFENQTMLQCDKALSNLSSGCLMYFKNNSPRLKRWEPLL